MSQFWVTEAYGAGFCAMSAEVEAAGPGVGRVLCGRSPVSSVTENEAWGGIWNRGVGVRLGVGVGVAVGVGAGSLSESLQKLLYSAASTRLGYFPCILLSVSRRFMPKL